MGTWHGMWQLTDSSCSAKFCHRASNDPWNHGWMLTPSKSMEKLWQRVMGKEREERRGEQPMSAGANRTLEKPGSASVKHSIRRQE